ncbi:methyl-accepting chemotaxis protein [Streptomyces sp. NPDC005566]|uniref:methyl-accepting chemotaxis protein n=1 Tax=Streptomyces sp. NPDC005566 TaxID=3156886 RepID=UPI0033B81B48
MPVATPVDRHEVSKQVKELSVESGLSSRRDELHSLGEALAAKDMAGLDPWVDLDLLHAFARPESISTQVRPGEGNKVWSWLEAALGALVFVPLLMTWYGLTQASSAYQALIGADPKSAARPFLQLWQSGFEGHLAGAFTFGHVATGATTAIALLFFLVLVHGIRRSSVTRSEEEAARDADRLMRRLVPVLTRAQLVLNVHRTASPRRFAAELTEAAATLTRLGARAVKVQKDLSSAAVVVGEAVERAEERLAGVDHAVRPLERAAGRIEDAVRDNAKDVGAAVSDNGTMVSRALDGARSASGEIRDVLDRAGERVEDSVLALAASQRSFTTGVEVAADVSSQVLARLSEVTEDSARSIAESHEALRRLTEHTEGLRRAAEQFGRITGVPPAVPVAATLPATVSSPMSATVPGAVPSSRSAHDNTVSLAKDSEGASPGDVWLEDLPPRDAPPRDAPPRGGGR